MKKNRFLFAGFAPVEQDRIREVLKKQRSDYRLVFLSFAEARGLMGENVDVQAVFISSRSDAEGAFGLLKTMMIDARAAATVFIIAPGDEATTQTALEHGVDECLAGDENYYFSLPLVLDRAISRRKYRCSVAERNESISQSRRKWVTIIDAITDFIFIVDEECRLYKMNQAFASLFDAHPKDLLGKKCNDLFENETPCGGEQAHAARQQGTPHTVEKLIRGELYQVCAYPFHTEPKPLTVYVMKNITETNKLKNLLYHSDKLASLGLLVGGVAHEINNPLTGIIGYAELLRMKPHPGDIDAELNKILEGAERCRKIVENLLTFSRQKAPAKHVASINSIIDKTIDLRSYWIRTNAIEIVREYGEPSTVFADAQQIQLVILNILLNAEQAINETGRTKGCIVFNTQYDAETRHILIRISDNGAGISPDKIPRIFNPFYTTKPVGTGTGLGLSISHSIVAEHGGKMWVESIEGKGTTLALTLPTSADAVHPPRVSEDTPVST